MFSIIRYTYVFDQFLLRVVIISVWDLDVRRLVKVAKPDAGFLHLHRGLLV